MRTDEFVIGQDAQFLLKMRFRCLAIPYQSFLGTVLQQTACMVVNPIAVGNFSFLFNCTPVGQTSDSMMDPT